MDTLDADLLELVLLQGGLPVVLNAAAVSRAFLVASKSNSLWKQLLEISVQHEDRLSIASTWARRDVADAREECRQSWERRSWLEARTGGLVRPIVPLISLERSRLSSDSRKLSYKIRAAACCSGYVCTGANDGLVRCYSISGQHVRTLPGTLPAQHGSVVALEACAHAGHAWLASGASDGKSSTIKLWGLHTGSESAALTMRHKLISQFDPSGSVIKFFEASEQAIPPIMLFGRSVPGLTHVEWRPDGTATSSLRHNLCKMGAASVDEPHVAFGAGIPGIARIDMRQPPPVYSGGGWPEGGYPEWRWKDSFAEDIKWMAANSRHIVGADEACLLVWDVRRDGTPLATVRLMGENDGRGYEEGQSHRKIKGIHLATRGRLVTTTFSWYSGNTGQVATWDVGELAATGSTDASAGLLTQRLKLPKPAQARSLLLTKLVGRQRIVALTPSAELGSWVVGGPP